MPPIPFGLAVVAVAVILWRFLQWQYQWRYDGTIEKLNAMLRLAAEENRIAKQKQDELNDTATNLAQEIEALRAKEPEEQSLASF